MLDIVSKAVSFVLRAQNGKITTVREILEQYLCLSPECQKILARRVNGVLPADTYKSKTTPSEFELESFMAGYNCVPLHGSGKWSLPKRQVYEAFWDLGAKTRKDLNSKGTTLEKITVEQ